MAGAEQLTDAEYERLAAVLERTGAVMNVETLEGFFGALICTPDTVRPSEYLRAIWGGKQVGGDAGWESEEELQRF